MLKSAVLASIAFVCCSAGTSVQAQDANPYFGVAGDVSYADPSIWLAIAPSTALACTPVDVPGADFAYCFSAGQHSHTVQFWGQYVYVSTPYALMACQLDLDNPISDTVGGHSASKWIGECWDMICEPGNCGQTAMGTDPHGATVTRLTGGGSTHPGGNPVFYFANMSAGGFLINDCYYDERRSGSGRTVYACYENGLNNRYVISQGTYLQVVAVGQPDVVEINCDEDPATRYTVPGEDWVKVNADCYWTQTNQPFAGIVGRR